MWALGTVRNRLDGKDSMHRFKLMALEPVTHSRCPCSGYREH